MHYFGHDAKRDETDDQRPQDRVALGRTHDSHHGATDNFRRCTAHGERDVTNGPKRCAGDTVDFATMGVNTERITAVESARTRCAATSQHQGQI